MASNLSLVIRIKKINLKILIGIGSKNESDKLNFAAKNIFLNVASLVRNASCNLPHSA
jgi:hypothetical protein